MKSENWKKNSEILPDCLELNISERRKYLDELHLDSKIRTEIESFLALEKETEDFMSATADGVAKDFFSSSEIDENTAVGQRIGIYKTEKEIGFGGMGVVYLAARTDGKVEQKVAVKMLKREFNVKEIRRTFRREKEILSKLNHPLIARLLDAGTTGDGVPYLVMEYIEGEPIDKFCENKNLSLNARLKLFNKVCEAVSFAHRNLIIHRDLKPSNILITEKGEPKLLDFGISKLLGAESLEEKTHLTAFGAMTPEYASPEQIKGETITTATDIYSLGVVLYKILTGSQPFELKGKTNGELLKIISENSPTTPSAVQITNYKLQISESKNSKFKIQNPKSKIVKGRLDTIILKALSKTPERRYQSVEQFAADIWRYIDGLPILARPATFSYRAGKFFRRNKLAVVAASLIFLSLITGMAVAMRQTNIAREQARLSAIETDRARTEEENTKKISQFMFKVIANANPAWYTEGAKFDGDARVIDVLDDLGKKIDIEFAGQADRQADLHHKFAEVYGNMGLYNTSAARAEESARKKKFHALRALELRREFYGERHELVAKDLFYSYAIIGKDDFEKAKLLGEAIQMMHETNPKNLNLPYMLEAYAASLILPKFSIYHEPYRKAVSPATGENNYQIAERYYREALPIFRLHYKEDNYAIIINECRLAYALAMQDKSNDFDEHYDVCRKGVEKLKDEKSSEALRRHIELVETVLAEKNLPK